ncbi:SDR family oxidoreductase [Pseudonocardia kujensis]|uniref:SDR family oxidoreductase n=1 Tax=Pseudonocardia kujensis TaxID=1128675 RepID=UPI001E5FF6C0|nr:SDR family oxidoreductase [Pseudonocardia kujensis]MCE0767745.1 SDR family oxidoreductase [Pseudonocardia kujensis]
MTEIAGNVALVTGGGSGIGRGLVLELAAQGASVVVADILRERAAAVAAEAETAGGRAIPVVCDVSSRESVRRMKAEANAAFGPVSLLFANAGVTCFDRLTDMTDGDVDWLVQVNLMGTVYCLRTFLPDMFQARAGHVVATASTAGLSPGWFPYHVPYVTTKSAIIAMMLNLRIELAEVGVGSTVYCAGGVRGSLRESPRFRPERFGGPRDGEPSELLAARGAEWSQKNLTEFLEPEEVAPHVLRAVRRNTAMVVDHSDQRQYFFEHFVDHAVAAFDEAAAWERSLSTPG